MTGGQPLVCPACGGSQPESERFCPSCGLPLVHPSLAAAGAGLEAGEDERHRLARKVDPRYVEGQPERVAWARNQTEAEFIQGLLLEEGIPSMLRRSRGFDVPDFLASGPRDVLVPASGLSAAREVLLQSEIISERTASVLPVPWHVMALLLGALVLVAIVILIATRL